MSITYEWLGDEAHKERLEQEKQAYLKKLREEPFKKAKEADEPF